MRKDEKMELIVGAILIVVVLAILGTMIWFAAKEIKADREFDAWYNSLTAEEQVAYEEPYTDVYEIVSVDKYVMQQTNRYGGVRGTYICYEFYYVDGDGNVQHIEQFCDDFSGKEVIVGEANTYAYNSRTKVATLTLTMDTIQKMSTAVE